MPDGASTCTSSTARCIASSVGRSTTCASSTSSDGPLEPAVEHLELVPARRVADAHPQQEAVELRLGQRVGALLLDRVLRCEYEERRLEQDACGPRS